jgi:heterodisulfide reductase subunit A
MLKVPLGVGNFFQEAHVKLRPLDIATDGIYLCGSANFPRSVPDTIAQASGVASRASIPMGMGKAVSEGITSVINKEMCVCCGTCETMCPYGAIRVDEKEVIGALCKGCGTCVAACPTGAINQRHFQNDQVLSQVKNIFALE